MLKSAFLNYGKNIKLILLIMGVVYLSLILVIAFIFMRLGGMLQYDAGSLLSELGYIFTSVFSTIGIQDFASGNVLMILMGNLTDALMESFYATVGSLVAIFIVGVIFILLSFMLAGFLCKLSIRKGLKDDDTRRGISAFIIRFLISSAFTIVLSVAVLYFFHLIYVFLFLYLALTSISNIIEIKIIYFRENKIKELLTAKNIFSYLLVFLIFFALTIGFIFLLSFIFNFLLALLIGIPFYIYFTETTKYTLVEYFRKVLIK